MDGVRRAEFCFSLPLRPSKRSLNIFPAAKEPRGKGRRGEGAKENALLLPVAGISVFKLYRPVGLGEESAKWLQCFKNGWNSRVTVASSKPNSLASGGEGEGGTRPPQVWARGRNSWLLFCRLVLWNNCSPPGSSVLLFLSEGGRRSSEWACEPPKGSSVKELRAISQEQGGIPM